MRLKTADLEQRNALLDLLVLGMYADRHLASAEDARIVRSLQAMGFDAESDRNREFDAAVTRLRKFMDSPASIPGHVKKLAGVFKSDVERKEAIKTLTELLAIDKKFSDAETRFLGSVREAFAEAALR